MNDFPTLLHLFFITLALMLIVYLVVNHKAKKPGHDRHKL